MKRIGDESTAVVGATPFPHSPWQPRNCTRQPLRAIVSRYDCIDLRGVQKMAIA